MLPDLKGIEGAPIAVSSRGASQFLFLTARDKIEDRVLGLDSGADDYLTKPPFPNSSLASARFYAAWQLRTKKCSKSGALNINLITRKASCGDKLLELTPREFDVLSVLANRCGDIVSREAPDA